MGLAASKRALIKTLLGTGFLVQRDSQDLVFVRDSDRESLFERIEFMFVGRRNEAAVLTMSVAVVRSIHTQFRGLVECGGLDALYTDRENGRVELSSEQVPMWLEKLALVAPTSVREYAHQRGPVLLERTQRARAAAQHAFVRFVEPVLARGLDAIVTPLTDAQRHVVSNLSSRPMVIGAEELKLEYEAAVSALTMTGDPDILRFGEAKVPPAFGHALIQQIQQVPDEVMWKIRILTDMIYRAHSLPN